MCLEQQRKSYAKDDLTGSGYAGQGRAQGGIAEAKSGKDQQGGGDAPVRIAAEKLRND